MYQVFHQHLPHQTEIHFQNPYRTLAISFLAVMLLGSFLLYLPISRQDQTVTSYTDALFTAVSCVSVTGLSTVDTYYHWSLFGRTVMVVLIQLGGLGIMTFTTLIAVAMGRKISLEGRLILQEDMGNDQQRGIVRIMRRVAMLTFAIEFVGGLIYMYQLYPYIGDDAYYIGFYQSISSFCNAGFVFFDNSLPYKMVSDWLFTLNTCGLIILGGFGYLSLFDLWSKRRQGFINYAVHTKIMLIGVGVLTLFGMLLILLLEWYNPGTLGPLSIGDKIQAAFFQSVTPRTAGVATLDYGSMRPTTIFLTIVLMFIGAGANSTGGGVKISTMVLVFLAGASIFSNRPDVEVYERKIPTHLINKAIGIVLFSLTTIAIATFVLEAFENIDFLRLLFEATSAFGTVGLTTGITPELSDASKWTLILVMYTGRIGVLTLIGSLALRPRRPKPISYPEGHIYL